MSGQDHKGIKQYNDAFLRELRRLNAAQLEAVDQIEGPVLVLAGPGTGKTHLLSARIGRILMETDAQAQNILCLTFTDAGVQAMRKRLLELIGPEARRVHIYTFHSFCNRVIQDNLEYFGRRDLEPLTELEQVDILRRMIDHLSFDHPLKQGRSDAYFYDRHLADLFQRMKSENWTAGFVRERIQAYLDDLPNRREFVYQVNRGAVKKGDLKQAQLDKARENMEKIGSGAALFPEYQRALHDLRRYDYDDMILWVLDAFRKNEALLRNYQEQYLYLLVDEYQDTNGAQNEILRNLAGYWESPNIFIVGDDDQSIYEFQGARLKNLTDFYELHRQAVRVVMLSNNYRSSQAILDVSSALIRFNEKRIVNRLGDTPMDKELVSSHPEARKSRAVPVIAVYAERQQEQADIASKIQALIESGETPGEIAVIFAKHRQGAAIAMLLGKMGIPYFAKRHNNALDLPMIRNFRLLLEYIHLESTQPGQGEHLLFKLLHAAFFRLPARDLALLGMRISTDPTGERPAWRMALQHAAKLKDLAPNLAGVGALLEELIADTANLPLPELIEKAANRSGLLAFILAEPDNGRRLAAFKAFFDFALAEAYKNPRTDLRRFLELLERMDANRIGLDFQQEADNEGVQLLTAHSAKGLEFRHVFVIDCTADQWEPGGSAGAYRFSFPDTLTFSGEEDALEARRRLFYVAMTRAKTRLQLSYSLADNGGKPLQPAVFIHEIQQAGLIEETPVSVPAEQVREAARILLSTGEMIAVESPGREQIARLLEGFTLSISALNRYLNCPLGFYYEQILRVPVFQSEAASYGIAVHYALQRFFERMVAGRTGIFSPASELVALFQQDMERQKALFSRQGFARRMEMGAQYLAQYYRQKYGEWGKKVRLELHIRNTEMDGVPITGTLDKLEALDARSWRLVDYKTGSLDESKLRKPGGKLPHGGSYWRQLVFYKLLYESFDRSGKTIASACIDYLEPDRQGRFLSREVVFEPGDLHIVRDLVKETYRKIMDQEFYEGCGKPSCPWCNFVRLNQPSDSYRDEGVEEMDD
ncbi:MAG TPA: ATP-dependent DNA helicase [Flavilitoribacter sp.]|nr:ATP-dependent DNA helicase [Flavilitoribacter sp.]HMQ89601.1 ATP-dependent DNA helicase [Flavilitoribacter sp.]